MNNTNTRGLEIYDTSLRDGTQKFIDYPTDEQAALMGASLAHLGIEHIEIGVPVSENQSKFRLESIIKGILSTGKNPVIYGFARCVRADIDAILDKMEIAPRKGLNIVVSGSELFQILRDPYLKNKNWDDLSSNELRDMEDRVLESLEEQIKYSRPLFEKVRICFEDGSMGKKDFLLRASRLVGEAGADVVSIPDTLGGVLSEETEELFKYLIDNTKDLQEKGLRFATHPHDDKGFALANAFGGVKGGATSIEGTLLGSGERVGNLNLKDFICEVPGFSEKIIAGEKLEVESVILKNMYETYKIICSLLGKKRNPYERHIGEMSTKTQVGIHQSLENRSSSELEEFFKKYSRITPYSLIDITEFGVPIMDVNIYTNLSGFSNLQACLNQYGINLSKDDPLVQKILDGIKPDLDNTKVVYASRVYLEYLVQTGEVKRISNRDINFSNDNDSITQETVSINLEIGGKTVVLKSETTKKDGMLGAAVNAINDFLNPEYSIDLRDFDLVMHEGVERISKRYNNILGKAYEELDLKNGGEQMGISNVEGVFIDNNSREEIPFKSTAFHPQGNAANIKAIVYASMPLIYDKIKNK